MAWWQHPEDQDTPPVTVERITEWYEQQGYKYGVDGDGERQYVVSGFGGFGGGGFGGGSGGGFGGGGFDGGGAGGSW